LNRLDPVESALSDRIAALSRATVDAQLVEVARSLRLDHPTDGRQTDGRPTRSGNGSTGTAEADDTLLTDGVRLQVGLITLAARERELYAQHFSKNSVSRRLAAMLIAHAGRLADRIKIDGVDGYRAASGHAIGFEPRFRFALWVQRRFRSSGMLAARLADRFEILLIQQLVLDDIAGFARRSVAPVLGEQTTALLCELVTERLDAVRQALAALSLQYPAYAAALGERHLARAGLRLEEAEYVRKHAESLISSDVFEALREKLYHRRREIEQRPPLDLGLKLTEMIRRVPILASLDQARLADVARQLCPLLALPGERVVTRGERGDAMYFIVAGELEVRLPNGSIPLKAGDFFGEMALLNAAPRVADVVANGYSQLLALKAGDFKRLLGAAPEVQLAIAAVAKERSAWAAEDRATNNR
jgi:CPA1 family monovalent cation:H+ antiporter